MKIPALTPFRFALRLCLVALAANAARAQTTLVWANGTGTWDTTTANWSGAAWTNGSNATIGSSAQRTGTITIQPGGVTVNNVSSGSGSGAAYGYMLTGGSITLAGPASTWTAGGPAGSQLLVDSVLTGSSSLEKLGSRLLILTGNNTYTGGTTITAGQLQIGNGGTSGSVAGNITANSNLIFNRSDTYTFGGVISGTSTITQAGSGTLVLTGENLSTSTFTVSAGTLQIGNGGTTGTYAGSITNNSALAFNRSDNVTFGRSISGTGSLTMSGAGTLTLTGANSYAGTTTVAAGTLRIDGNQAGSPGDPNAVPPVAAVTAASGLTTVQNGATLTGAGKIGGSVVIANGGTLLGQSGQVLAMAGLSLNGTANVNVTLGAPNSTGLFLVNGDLALDGVLNVNGTGSFGPGLYRLFDYTGALTDNGLDIGSAPGSSGANLAVQTSVPNQVNLFYNAGAPNIWHGGAGTWTADAGSTAWTDIIGTVTAPWTSAQFAIFQSTPGNVAISTTAGAVEASGAQFAVNGYTVSGQALTDNTPDAVFRVGNGAAAGANMTATISAPITGTGGLNKTDLGTLVLSGNNSYSGATTVTNGTLRIDGDQSAAAGAVTVATGAKLAGAGRSGGAVTVASGGTLLGQTGQTLTTGTLTFSSGSNLNLALGAPGGSALFQVNGNLTLAGTLNVADAAGFGPGSYSIFNYTGTLANQGLAFGATPVAAQYLALQTSVASQINLIFDAGARSFWGGGSGTWTAGAGSTAWTDFGHYATGSWQPDFAIFQGTSGTVTIDTGAGPVVATGAQFAVNGYTVAGGALTENTAGAVFRVGDGTAAGAAMTATISAPINGTGGINKTDLGTLVLSGSNTYAGTTTVTNGTLRVDGNQSGATGAVSVASGATLSGQGTLGGAVSVAAGGVLSGQSGQTLATGALTLNSGSIVNVTLGAPGTTGLFQVGGDLTLAGTLNVATTTGYGPGTYRIFDYSGNLTNNGLAFGTLPGTAQYFSLQTSLAQQVNFVFTPGASNFWAGGAGTWSADPANTGWRDSSGTVASAWQPQFAIFQATPGTVTVSTTAGAVVIQGAQFAANGYTVAGGALTNNTAGAVFRVGDGTAAGTAMTATVSAPITGTGGLNKTDLGTLVLSGANTYAGATTVSNGTLRINGDQSAATGAVTVASGATLAGAGKTGGAVTVADGGILAGQSGQTLTTGALTLSSASIVNVALGTAGTTPLFQVNGNLTLDGTLNLAGAPGFGPGLYRIFNYTGLLTNNLLDFGTTAGLGADAFSLSLSSANQVNLLYRDLVTPLPLWAGGSGRWSADPAASGFVNADGSLGGGWRPGLAIFQGTPGTVTVSNSAGAVVVTGIQFASSGYTVAGETLTTNTAAAPFRVGDGTSAGAAMTATIGAPITGTGGINKTDLGTLILSGASTYTGGTTVTGGVLSVSSDVNLGAASGGLTLAGGTLRGTAAFTSARPVALSAASTIDSGTAGLVLQGVISGTGALTKTGTGVLTLGGANTYTGATTIAAGTVMLNNSSLSATTVAAGATLAGNGNIRGNLTNQGLLSPGASPGTLTVNGNFTQAATGSYSAELASATSYDKVSVTGTATLGGSLAVTGLGGFVPQVGQTFTVLSAAGGVSGSFASVTSPWDQLSAMLRFQPTYNPTSVTLAMTQRSFASVARTPNQAAVGGAIDAALASSSLLALRPVLNALPTEDGVRSAMDELSPRRYERWFDQTVYASSATMHAAQDRLGDLSRDPRGGLWFDVVSRSATFDAEGESRAAKSTSTGFLLGGDAVLNKEFQIGLLFGYADEKLDLDSSGSTSPTKRFNATVYSRLKVEPIQFDFAGGLGKGTIDSRRTVNIPGYASVATASTETYENYLSLRAGYPLIFGRTQLMPYAGVQYVHWQSNDTTETGAGDAGLHLLDLHGLSFTSRAGFTLARTIVQGSGTLTPRLDVAWSHELSDVSRDLPAALGGQTFTVQSRRPETSGLVGSLGLDATINRRLSVYGRLTTEWNTTVSSAFEARAGVMYRF